LAETAGAINLSQGLPDFPCPAAIKKAACKAILNDENQYSFTYGLTELREAVAEKLPFKNKFVADPESEITITCGVSEGIVAACLALLESGDEVIIFEPFYENYVPAVTFSGAVPRFYSLKAPDWSLDAEQLRTLFTNRTKAILINNPMNPTGKVFSKAELECIAQLCEEWNVVAITDEIYEDLVYSGATHISLASLAGMKERTVSVMGFSKTYAVTGWRVGYVCAPVSISVGIRKVHDFLTICAPTPLQQACLAALDLPVSFYEEIVHFYEKKRRLFCLGLRDLGFQLAFPQAAYYVMTDFSAIRSIDDVQFAEWLLEGGGVAVVPGSSFYHAAESGHQLVRFCFAKREETLVEALQRMGKKILRSKYEFE